jgi:DNA-directed RNA polymerase specialized sigma subunit
MIDTWQHEACVETYDGVEMLLYHTVNKFRRRYRLDYDDAKSAAMLGFVQAYDTFDPSIDPSFNKWVLTKVWSNLFDAFRRQIQDSKRPLETTGDNPIEYMESFPEPHKPEFRVADFIGELSDDAKFVVTMVFNPPKQVVKTVKKFGEDTDINLRMAVKHFLIDTGWAVNRIRRAFREVRNAL